MSDTRALASVLASPSRRMPPPSTPAGVGWAPCRARRCVPTTGTCYLARPSDADAVARMRERGHRPDPHHRWTLPGRLRLEIVVAAYLTRCRHCGRLFSA